MRLAFCVACVAALLVAAPAGAREIDKTFEKTFDVSEGAKLRLFHGDGDAVITPWDKDVIAVNVRYHADLTTVGFGTDPDFDVEFKQKGDVVTVRGIEGSSSGVFIVRTVREYEYTYTISAPSYVLLDLEGDDGDVDVSGWRADIRCRMDDGDVDLTDIDTALTDIAIEDGDIRIENLEGELLVRGDDGSVFVIGSSLSHARVENEDGDVKFTDSRGSFEVSVDDGDVTLSRVAADVVDVRGNDGGVDLDLLGEGEIHVNISVDDGDVVVRLAEGLSFDYLVTVDDGDVSVNLTDATETHHGNHRLSGSVRGGGGLVRVSGADGDVTLITGS
jgi:hypothetical protein